MNVVSLIFAIVAAAIFFLADRTPWATVSLGLFFLTLAWMAQLLITSGSITL